MLARQVFQKKVLYDAAVKSFSTSVVNNTKVTVLGSSGGIGQPLSLLLKQNPLVDDLALYDIVYSPGIAADLTHVATKCRVRGYGPGQIRDALEGADVVICAAGQPRKAGQSREDQFNVNSRIVKDVAVSCSMMNPNAIYGIISNPINSTVPLFCEMFQKAGVLDENKIMGITTLGGQRVATFLAQEKGWDASSIVCPVIGGHAGVTIVPVLSQCKPSPELTMDKLKLIVYKVREAGVEIVEAKQGSGTVTLSMAWSAHKFTNSLLRALKGEKGIVECAYVKSNVGPTKYFQNPLELGTKGVAKNLGIPQLNEYEKALLSECIPTLKKHIEAGEAMASAQEKAIMGERIAARV